MVIQRSFGSSAPGSGQLLSPTAVAIDESGDVWVLNGKEAAEGGRIVEFSASIAFVGQVAPTGQAQGSCSTPTAWPSWVGTCMSLK